MHVDIPRTYTVCEHPVYLIQSFCSMMCMGTLTWDFLPLVFFINQLPLGPRYTGLSLFEYGFEDEKKINYEIAGFCHSSVIDKRSLDNPHIFCMKVIGIVQDNLFGMFFGWIFPLKVARASQILGPTSQRCHISTALSLTLQKPVILSVF
jgi:hypothetical protein